MKTKKVVKKLPEYLAEARKGMVWWIVNQGVTEADASRIFNVNQSTIKRILRGR
jgi:transposase